MDDLIVNEVGQVASHFKRSVRQVHRWLQAGAPRLSDGSFDLVQIKRWLKRRRKGAGLSNRDPAYGWCRARLGELVSKEVEALILAGLMDVEAGLNTISRALAMHGELSDELLRLILFSLQALGRPLLKQVGSIGSLLGPELQLRITD